MTEPMTDAPHRPIDVQSILDRLRRIEGNGGGWINTVTLRSDEATAILDHIGAYAEHLGAVEARLDAERSRADAAEAARDRHMDEAGELFIERVTLMLQLADAKRALAKAEAARDAALARAMPEPVLMETVEQVEALPDGNYAYCFGTGRRLRGLATKRNRIWTFIGTDDECEPNSAEMVDTWVSGPLPDLPTPTPTQEG